MNVRRERKWHGCGLVKADTAWIFLQVMPYRIFIALHIKVSTYILGIVKIVISLAAVILDLFCLLILFYLYYLSSSPELLHFQHFLPALHHLLGVIQIPVLVSFIVNNLLKLRLQAN